MSAQRKRVPSDSALPVRRSRVFPKAHRFRVHRAASVGDNYRQIHLFLVHEEVDARVPRPHVVEHGGVRDVVRPVGGRPNLIRLEPVAKNCLVSARLYVGHEDFKLPRLHKGDGLL